MKKNLLSKKSWSRMCRVVTFIGTLFWAFLAHANARQNLLKPERLENYLKKIEKVHHVSFVYDAEEINKAALVNVPEKLGSIQESLEQLKKVNIGYRIINNQVVLKTLPAKATAQKKNIVIKGTVKDKKDGSAIPGVNVSQKGFAQNAVTNLAGEFQITVEETSTLVFKYVGYKTLEVAVGGRTRIDVVMEEDNNMLKEVNIVSNGYQTISRKLFTGASAAVRGSDVKQDGVTDISRMLEGRVAGVSVQNISGTFGTAPKVRVRGATSISGENKPLWVIDGIVLEDIVNISNDQLSSGDATTLLGSSIAGINADDIESINVLKDASATALYGARAMNGVVVVTTKRGKSGNTQVNYNGNFSTFLKPTYDTYNIMNSADQMSLYSEVARKGGLTANVVNGMNGGVYSKMYQEINRFDESSGLFGVANTPEGRSAFLTKYARANTNWFDVLFRNSFVQEHSVSVTSGSEKTQHYFSVGYYNDQGWTIADNAKRFTMNLRGDYTLSPKISIAITGTGAFRKQRVPGTLGRTSNVVEGKYTRDFDTNPFSYALNTSRTARAYDDNGNLEFFTRNYAPFNIIQELDNNWIDLDMIDTKLQGEFKYKFLKGFEFRSLGALRYVKTTREYLLIRRS
jgi:TonB-linked SusC/RagA family outer membrane protein